MELRTSELTGRSSDEFTKLLTRRSAFLTLLRLMAGMQRVGMTVLRIGLVIVLLWIGGLKFADYEADSIVPFVANSPLIGFTYSHAAPEYRQYMNKEGELVPAHRRWHTENRTYVVSHLLGITIVGLGLAIALHKPYPRIAAIGSTLLIGMTIITLSFLVTTPEVWVPPLGDSAHGFPFLSGSGRLVVKDFIILGAAIATMADSARAYLVRLSA